MSEVMQHQPADEAQTISKKIRRWGSLKWKLIFFFSVIAIVPLLIVGSVTIFQAQVGLLGGGQARLEASRTAKVKQIQQYFDSVAQDIQSVARLEVINEAHRSISPAASRIVGLDAVHNSDFLGDPERTESATFNAYSLAHNEHYDLLANITKAGGYADLMLVNSTTGDIVYTYAKNDDFATNLQDGPYSDTHLGKMVQQMLEEREKGKIYMADFEQYAPTGGAPVSFVGTYLNNEIIRSSGILIYELAIDDIDQLMKDQTGLGEPGETSGETYLVGSDNLMRSNSPLVEKDTFFDPEVRVDTPAVAAGLEGKTGFIPELTSYRDTTVLSAYQPVDLIGDVEWVLLAEIEKQEALQGAVIVRNGIVVLIILVGVLAVALGLFIALRISSRIEHLTYAARQIMNGDFMVQIPVESQDETGELAQAFTTMTAQLRELIGSLEDQVAERTRGLETVVDISQQLAGILELSNLLQQVVILIKERFNYYHVHIYLIDDEDQKLVMAEGYGRVGVEMKRQNHSIDLNARSLVARAARQRHTVLVEDVHQDPEWLPNELLPETQSEMAVPIISGNTVLGVLDVQANEVGGLTEEDGAVLWVLANQVAVAVRTAETFTETQRALSEAEKMQRLYTGQAWERFGATRPTTDYEIRQAALPPIEQIATPEAVTAAQHKQTIGLRIGGDGEGQPGIDEYAETALATPLRIGEEVIGVLGVRDKDPDRRWTEEETALIEAVSEQMSLAIENARLFEETGRRAGRERVIADVTRQIWASGDLEYVMRTAVEQLGKTLDASKVVIRLGTEDRLVTTPNGSDNADEVSVIDDTGNNYVAADTIKFNVADVIGGTDDITDGTDITDDSDGAGSTDDAEGIDVSYDIGDIDDNYDPDDPDEEMSA